MRILIAEDEESLRRILVKRFSEEHYKVDAAADGEEALDCLRLAEYDAIILDIMMPRVDGLTVLKKLREGGARTPVLLLTARDAISDRVSGLDQGADDYLVKPFALDELLARVRVMIRRSTGSISNRFQVGDLIVDCDARSVSRAGVPIALTSREFDVLEYLVRNSGTVLSRDRISQHLFNYDYEGASNVIDVYIRYLRKKLDDGHAAKLIHTVRGAGYVLREEI